MGTRVAVVLVLASVAFWVTACGPTSSPSDGGREGQVLSASQVGGDQTGSGTDLFRPAAESCRVDGPFLWGDARDQDVRAFKRTVDEHTERTVVGAWPMPKNAGQKALKQISIGPRCNAGGWTVEGQAGVGNMPTRAFEVRKRNADRNLEWWSLRAYTYANGHMIAVWAKRTDSRPSIDGVRDLLEKQKKQLGP